MYIRRNVDTATLFHFGWRVVVIMLAWSSLIWFAHATMRLPYSGVPFLPIATIGTAVAFYVGFKNNSSYDRLWEARKIWGEITNQSRSLACYLVAAAGDEGREEASIIVRRQILFINLLRAQLRKRAVWEGTLYTQLIEKAKSRKSFDEEMQDAFMFCSCETERGKLQSVRNAAKQVMYLQIDGINSLKKKGIIDGYEASDLIRICTQLIDQQGKAERIKNFPFPRQYAYFSEVFVRIFMFLLPFGLIPEFDKLGAQTSWLAIPFSTLIAWIFTTMEQVGDTSENPFEYGINDVPLNAICRNIEIDLLELIDAPDVPAPLEQKGPVMM